MSEAEIERVLWAFRERMPTGARHPVPLHPGLQESRGAAGATLEHSHSQLIAVPIVPDFVREELEGAKRHFAAKERCVFCDIIRQEVTTRAARHPRERRRRGARAVCAAVSVRDMAAAAQPQRAVRGGAAAGLREPGADVEIGAGADERALESPAYNLIIHNSPFSEQRGEFYHWHVELMPKLTRMAGFEWGTGFYINPTSPEEAAQVLRAAN